MPVAQTHPVFKNEKVYEGQLFLKVPLSGEITKDAKLMVSYQGCSANVCHLPVSQAVKLDSHVLPIGNDFNWLELFIQFDLNPACLGVPHSAL